MTGDPHPKPASTRKRPPTADEREQRDRFKQAVLIASGGTCLVHRGEGCEGPMQAHHVITQQQLRDRGRHDLLWDWRNGVAICEDAHVRHTKAVERIARAMLPTRCIAWATLYGFDALIDRYYTPEDA